MKQASTSADHLCRLGRKQKRFYRVADRRAALGSGFDLAEKFGRHSTGFASGWMMVRGARRRRAIDRGFVLSDHADWPELLSAISATHAETVYVTHGFSEELVRWLNESGTNAKPLKTEYHGEGDALDEVLSEEFVEGKRIVVKMCNKNSQGASRRFYEAAFF